ncbi:MAG: hypothetical protein OXF88_03345 [Rhodobacteraceae bacterium]|nr:hypothetical protein [Paracoccaceae bacterium]
MTRTAAAPLRDGSADSTYARPQKATTALARMEQGNFSNVKGVGAGILEYRIDFGPGYRSYFGKDGATLVVLLGGGTKARQQRDIVAARNCWQEYKWRKRQEGRDHGSDT